LFMVPHPNVNKHVKNSYLLVFTILQ
jgi:hypothetical protein